MDITIKKHLSVLIGSVNKIYNKAKINGELKARDVYYLNTLFKLLSISDLSYTDKKQISTLYNNISFCSDYICPPVIYKSYNTTIKPNFQQAESTDCNTYPAKKEILYWQEPYTLSEVDILTLLDDTTYLVDKPFDTYPNFDMGKSIDYTEIGRLVFIAIDANTTDLKIYDALNNDVTHTFNKTLYPIANGVIFVSQNIYSHGIINFKIKET